MERKAHGTILRIITVVSSRFTVRIGRKTRFSRILPRRCTSAVVSGRQKVGGVGCRAIVWRSSTVQLRSMELLAIGGKEKESQVDPKRAHLRKETIDRALLLRSRSIASPFLHRLLYPSLSFPLSLSLSFSFSFFLSFLFFSLFYIFHALCVAVMSATATVLHCSLHRYERFLTLERPRNCELERSCPSSLLFSFTATPRRLIHWTSGTNEREEYQRRAWLLNFYRRFESLLVRIGVM